MNRLYFRWLFVAPIVLGITKFGTAAETPAVVTQIIAHRGSSADRPENTLASTERAVQSGATAIEVDVRTTSDGHLVILHDATLDRTTNGEGRVESKSLAHVRQLDAGQWFDAKYRGQRVPTLQEILSVVRSHHVDILLDVKVQGTGIAQKVAAVVNSEGVPSRTIVGVRSIEQARLFRKLLPAARQLGLIPNPDQIEAFAEAGVETIRLWPKWLKDKPDPVQRVRNANARLHLNGTTGLPNEVRELLTYRPDSLSSDDPARLVMTLAELHKCQPTSEAIHQ